VIGPNRKAAKVSLMSECLVRPHLGCLLIALSIVLGGSPHAATPTFTPTGSMHVPRAGHQATLLLDGRVLVTGGYDDAGRGVAQAEIFSAVTGMWSMVPGNAVARIDHTATRLWDGRVLLVGGGSSLSQCVPIGIAEIYDPATGGWSPTGDVPITVGRGMIAILLRDGRVLVSGGNRCGTILSTAALFNPSTNTWSATASMETPRAFHSAVLLAEGVLVIGGSTAEGEFSRAAEVYNPSTATWRTTEGPRNARGISCGGYVQPFLAILQGDSVLAAAGISGNCASGVAPAAGAELFDPINSQWSAAGNPEVARALTTATALSDGRVLLAGGYSASGVLQSSAEFFDPAAGGWNLLGALRTPRAGHTATRLANGSVLIAGGSSTAGRTGTAEIYLPEIAHTATGFLAARGFGDRTGDHFFGKAWSVATNSKGHVFISYAPGGERRIVEWLPDAWALKGYIREIGAGLEAFHSIRIDKNDNIWAVVRSTNTIVKFDPEGRVLLEFGRQPQSADGVEASPPRRQYLNGPTDLTWDPAGNVFVSDGESARIVKYDAAGHFITAVGRQGSAPGEMKMPHSLAADADGRLYVADGGNARIQVFDSALNLLAIYDTVGHPWAVCVTRGPHQYLYSSSNSDKTDMTRGRSTGEVYKLELDGTIVGKFGRSDNALGNFWTLHSVDCRRDNEIVATEFVDWMRFIRLQP
jgi:hypothetical protein